MLPIGTPAPDFTATLDDGSTFHLADYRSEKNVVLYFYPRDFTRGCTKEACSLRDNYATVEQHGAIIVGVSSDGVDAHLSFRDHYRLPFPLIADPERRIITLYDARGLLKWMTNRVTYVIDRGGIIRAAFRHELLIGRHTTKILEALAEIEGQPAAT
ncbi:MAG TPA: peroxiredoxin [Tepidiformaceae bacterium]